VVSVTGDNSDGPTSTGVGTDGTTSTGARDSDEGAACEQENSSSRLISVEDSCDIDGGGPLTGASPTRVMALWRRSPENRRLVAKDGLGHQSCGGKVSPYDQL